MKLDSSNDVSLEKKNSSTVDQDEKNEVATNETANKTKVQQSSETTNDANVTNGSSLENNKSITIKTKNNEWEEYHEKLLRVLKKEVKQIMEQAVTKKYVHEESSSIISLCAAVDACLSHGLKRRALGLFKTNSTTALLQKTAKNCDSAAKVYKIVTELEKIMPKGSSSNDSLNNYKFRLSLTKQTNSSNSTNSTNSSNVSNANGNNLPTTTTRYLWIRVALFERKLYDILEHLVSNYSIYYEKEALVADPVGGQIMVDLLVGPCTLDYTRMKCQDHIYADPAADELIIRHNLISSPNSSSSSPLTKTCNNSMKKAPLYLPYYNFVRFNFANSSSSGSNDTSSLSQSVDNHEEVSSPVHTSLAQRLSLNSPFSPKDYVESLHQNCKSTLLYGKNNVYVQPNDNDEALAGYLSLHQNYSSLEVKWTPNQLMKGNKDKDKDKDNDKQEEDNSSVFWDYALNIDIEDTVYLHCHHNDEGGLAVFIGHDGVQKPSIRFPKGSHLLAFLTCLEAGLLPNGQLDPPLGIQKGKGKVFPMIKKRSKNKKKSSKTKNGDKNEEEEDKSSDELTSDYVFRIVFNSSKPESISEEMFNPKSKILQNSPSTKVNCLWKPKAGFRQRLISTSSNSSTNSSRSLNEDFNSFGSTTTTASSNSIQTVCETMKHQIISRAFCGWLAYVRHLKTVRTHLSALVNKEMVKDDPSLKGGLTEQIWLDLRDEDERIKDKDKLIKLVYFGGCEPSIRAQVWPYLLGHYDCNYNKKQCDEHDLEQRHNYDLMMAEWSSVEAIIKIRDRENLTASLAKFNSEERNVSKSSKTPDKNQQDKASSKLTGKQNTQNENNKTNANEEPNDLTMENLMKGAIEENEICDECKFEEGQEEVDSKSESRPSSALKRQRNVYTQSSQQSTAQYAISQILITDASIDLSRNASQESPNIPIEGRLSAEHSRSASPASSSGNSYTNETLDIFSLNMHRIEKDVSRCDRQLPFFMVKKNLDKLRNIICTYVWKNLPNGYVQGFCDLAAPLLVVLDDEMLTYSCFTELMKRMSSNFPYTVATSAIDAMDLHFSNMRSLIQILDPDLFELMHSNGVTHFYFCYRWFLLDFKREFVYEDVFKVWEVIWTSKTIASSNMVLFIALALVQQYRDIILDNNMDFTDVIKFFNEMAEHHEIDSILENARKLVYEIQALIN